jgi:hypothetical protein
MEELYEHTCGLSSLYGVPDATFVVNASFAATIVNWVVVITILLTLN